ncbi:G protein-coupled receptor GPR1-like protein 2 [Colletotrichum chlorophyti]|uniref:G protein-coupled receptor GPR1-like protein 2 n=1 Tax=Colletotrichum chlorophyti TaxID=708187 RepID=A0A1Q8RWY6_9PEZI|nr:G protein-coupled receptor GPR1-like protein 2 [Colletotrichum chlorophyti]
MVSLPPDINLSQFSTSSVPEVFIVHRTLAYDRIPEGLAGQHWRVIQFMSLAVATLSFASTAVASRRFSRTRRGLRHDLITLLMLSEVLKSLLFIVFPIVDFQTGPVASESSFCQASGFFLSVSIEASDAAVVLSALHSVICLLRPQQSRRQNGSNPRRRRLVFSAFAFFPLLMASLAFINWPGYVNNGGYCYLPVRPEWTRLALSWVPRYMILLTIFALYAHIYIYVTSRMRRFSRINAMRRASATLMPDDRHWAHIPSVSAKPTSRRGSEIAMEEPERRWPSSTATTRTAEIELLHSRQKITWNWPTYAADDNGRIPVTEEALSPRALEFDGSPRSATFQPISPPPQSYNCRDTVDPRYHYQHQASYSTQWPSPSSLTSARAKSVANIWSILRRSTSLESDPEHNATPFLFHPAMDGTGMTKMRDKVRRQLRMLFAYPLVYTLIWAIPFAAHIAHWGDPEDPGPFVAVLLSLLSLSMQGLVNSWVFCAIEALD